MANKPFDTPFRKSAKASAMNNLEYSKRIDIAAAMALEHGYVRTYCALTEVLIVLEGGKSKQAKSKTHSALGRSALWKQSQRELHEEVVREGRMTQTGDVSEDMQWTLKLCQTLCAFAVRSANRPLLLSAGHCTEVFYDEFLLRNQRSVDEIGSANISNIDKTKCP